MCYIRRRYSTGAGADLHMIVTALLVGRTGGLRVLLKDSSLHLTEGQDLEATLLAGDKPVDGYSAKVLSVNEIGIFPTHARAFAAVLDSADMLNFKSPVIGMEFPVAGDVIGWARACARRNGIAMEPGAGL